MTTTPLDPLATRIVAQTTDALGAFDVHFRFSFWNPAMERLFGLTSSEAVGRPISEVLPPLWQMEKEGFFRRALGGENVALFGRQLSPPRGGRSGVFDCTASPLYDESGVAVGGLVVLRDVTAHRRAEDQLRESETRFRTMADAAPVLLWMSEPDGLCTFFNQTWIDFTGRTQEEEWGVGWAERVHFEDFQLCMDTYTRAFNRREIFEMEYRLQRKDGQFRWILDRGVPRYTPEGTFAGYIGSCVDITERRALEDELRKAVRMRDEFLSVASHELKTPLTSLQLQVDSLRRQATRAAEGDLRLDRVERAATAIAQQSRRLTELIDVLLDVSRINAGLLSLEYQELDLLTLVRAAIARWNPAVHRRDAHETPAVGAIELVAREEEPQRGAWDRLRLEQILNNLLSNAVKYGSNAPILVRIEGAAEWVQIEVEDHGIGISPENQARIFERFERAVSSTHYGGLGLGLWISREIVRSMGGEIAVSSQIGKGSVFRVRLPRHGRSSPERLTPAGQAAQSA